MPVAGGSTKATTPGGAAASTASPSLRDAAAPRDLRNFRKRVRSAKGRISICAQIAHEALYGDLGEQDQKNLALALRAIKTADDLVLKQELPNHMKALSAQLQMDREERARMESGVEFADEGAQLPPLSGDECH